MFLRKNNEDIIAGLDIGTSKICAVVAEKRDDGEVKIIGSGVKPSHGIRKGIVVNVESTIESIIDAVNDAEKMSKTDINSVYITITGAHIKSSGARGSIIISNKDNIINDDDIRSVIDKACNISLPDDMEVIHSLPQEYVVDGQDGIKNPKGMIGTQLDVDVHLISGSVASERNIIKTVTSSGFDVEGVVVQSLASSIAVLKREERDSGVLLIDMGGGTTDFIVFVDGLVRQSEVFAVGGDHITNDISIGLKVSIPIAEKIKKKYGCGLTSMVAKDEEFIIEGALSTDKIRIPRRKLVEIMQMRIEEIISIIAKHIDNYEGLLSAGIVLTGGCCNIPGFEQLVKSKMDIPVRIGKPLDIYGQVEVLDAPEFAASIGLVKFGLLYGGEGSYYSFSPKSIFKKFSSYFGSIFRKKG
ncbi:cell division protein FtsA [bacterium]|jgi:cell division protein FtsA|nr:cell division protein FtsA [bacterium]